MMNKDDDPILADFGLARLALEPGLTQAGSFLGTPYYASPEQAKLQAPDERSDLYSLGVVLFEILTGQRPFGGDSIQEVLRMHRETMPPNPVDLRPGIPFSLSTVVLRCLEKDPRQRYQTARDLRQALEALS
jgi:serine/threonine protein kinase